MHSLNLISEMITSGFADNILNILAISSIFFGISVIINNNPVISILYLIGLIASIAIYLISEGFTFLGLSYLIVYVGAVSILFLFILMLLDIRLSELQSNTSNSIPLTLIIGIYFCYYLLQFLPYNIAIIGGGTNLYGALNLKLLNLLNEVTVTAKGKELFLEGNYVIANNPLNSNVVLQQQNRNSESGNNNTLISYGEQKNFHDTE
jgi:NADH-ubiquinone oxidoreductase chain 6